MAEQADLEEYDMLCTLDGVEVREPSTKQVGGNHYKGFNIQPSEFCQKNKLPHLESNAIKYICRAHVRGKEPVQDIKKAIHCLELLLEWEYGYVDDPATAKP